MAIARMINVGKTMSYMINFHSGWFTKKKPTSPQKTVFSLCFLKDFGTCDFFLGGPTKVEN